MARSELDWTFDHIPAELEAESSPPRPSPERPARRVQARRRWILPAALVGLTAAAGLSVYLVYSIGWQRVRAQVASEVAYEDAQSLAGNVNAVLAVQSPDDKAWREQRTREVRLGLAARPPADNLLPVAEPPQVVAVNSGENGSVEVTVVRRFADSAGQTYPFEYVQRYRSLKPGVWAHVPPDEASLAATTTWVGERVSATLPMADQPWLEWALPQIDQYLAAACADWQCPDDLVVPVIFAGRADRLPMLSAARRPEASDTADVSSYPIVFDLAFRMPRYPRGVVLPSLHLAGYPHDAAAAEALLRSVTVQLLEYMTSDIAQSIRSGTNEFLDALIARAEVRLGLSAQPDWSVALDSYIPPDSLWPFARGTNPERRPDITARLNTFAFLDFALAGQPAEVDGLLLRDLRGPSLAGWLEQNAGVDGEALIAAWEGEVTARLASSNPPDWQQLNGLAYTCTPVGWPGREGPALLGAWLVRDGRPQPLPLGEAYAWLAPEALSPDGAFLAVTVLMGKGGQLQLLNLADQEAIVVAGDPSIPLGWSAAGELAYLRPDHTLSSQAFPYQFELYNPQTGAHRTLSRRPVLPPWVGGLAWTADHSALAVTVVDEGANAAGSAAAIPAVTMFGTANALLTVADDGHSAAVSPDGQYLAYVSGSPPWRARDDAVPHIEVVDLPARRHVYLLPTPGIDSPGSLTWSPDRSRLAFVDFGEYPPPYGARLLLWTFNGEVASEASQLHELAIQANFVLSGFSADGRYLAAYVYADDRSYRPHVVVYDLQTGAEQVLPASSNALAWSPEGHLLAVGGPGGLYVTDLATGANHWITGADCRPAWYRLP